MKIQFVISTKIEGEEQGYNDAAEASAPIWAPITPESYALYGEIDQNEENATKFYNVLLPQLVRNYE